MVSRRCLGSAFGGYGVSGEFLSFALSTRAEDTRIFLVSFLGWLDPPLRLGRVQNEFPL